MKGGGGAWGEGKGYTEQVFFREGRRATSQERFSADGCKRMTEEHIRRCVVIVYFVRQPAMTHAQPPVHTRSETANTI